MISVIVPVYNIEKYVERCILSILHQTYTDFELLLINDGSTDSSCEICRKWEQADSRVKVITKPNGGVSSARNLGLDTASGDYIFFADGDDWLRQDCLEILMSKMTPDIDLVIGEHADFNDDDGYVPPEYTSHKNHEGVISHEDAMADFFRFQFYPKVVWAKLFRKHLWDNIRFNHMVYSEDTYAMFQIFEKVGQIYCTSEPVYYYLQRASGASRELNILQFENYLETLMFMYNSALTKYPVYKEFLANYYNGFAYVLLKKYYQTHQKQKAFRLIKKMKYVFNTSETSKPAFSQRMLALPKTLVYHLIGLKLLLNEKE